jgi:hypothetical protein
MSRQPHPCICHKGALPGSTLLDDIDDVPSMHDRKVGGPPRTGHQPLQREACDALKWGLPRIAGPQLVGRNSERIFSFLGKMQQESIIN